MKLKIECEKCDNKFYEDWDEVLNYRGIRPGMEWGIDKVRFYALPIVYCAECHSKCCVELVEKSIKLQ